MSGESLRAAVRDSAPDEVYHLAAETQVSVSREDREGTLDVVAAGTERLLEAVAEHAPKARFFYSASSEVFGKPEHAPQDENTPLAPRNPYGDAKVVALETLRRFRDERGLWAAGGILYNHESPRRPLAFVTRKVTWHAAAIAVGQADELRLGNLDAQRDWGYAARVRRGRMAGADAPEPADYVFATGVLHSVRELVETAFARAGVPVDGRVVVDAEFVRPEPPVPMVRRPRAGAGSAWAGRLRPRSRS